MKLFLSASVLLYLFITSRGENGTYSTRYDGVNLDEILSSQRLLTGYVNCLLDQGPCTPDGKELKKDLPDAIDNDCKKCSRKQQEGSERVMHYIIDNRPEDWEKLEQKYNEDGTYKRKYLASKKNTSREEENDGTDEKTNSIEKEN